MLLVHEVPIVSGSDCCVAALTAGRLQSIIAMIWWRHLIGFWALMTLIAVGRRAMHFMAGMAIHTSHSTLAEVDISLEILMLSHVFIPDPAAVAGSAVIGHGGFGLEDMAINEPAVY